MGLVTLNLPLIGTEALEQAIIALNEALATATAVTSKVTAVVSTGTPIVFDTPKTGDYSIFAHCNSSADGSDIGYTISDKTVNGFTVNPIEDGNFEWFTILKSS